MSTKATAEVLQKCSHSETHQNKSEKVKLKSPEAQSELAKTTTSRMSGWLWLLLKVAGSGAIILYVGVPCLIWLNPWIQPKIVFLNMVRWPPMINLSEPQSFGLEGARHMYMQNKEEFLGVWHILPQSLRENKGDIEDSRFEAFLSSGKPVILYLHGNTGTRAGWHRVQLYKLLADMDFHVVAVDYRGFGDSTGSPSENGVCEDAVFVYEWIKQRTGDSPLFIWGHSLGTGVTTKVAKILTTRGELPVGIVLESPFNNIREAATCHPMASPFKYLPWFSGVFLDTIHHNDIHFASDQHIVDVSSPLLILHAHDDVIVPFELGKKLYHAAKNSRQSEPDSVTFVEFLHHHGYGHKHIFKAPELPDIIRKFVDDSISARAKSSRQI